MVAIEIINKERIEIVNVDFDGTYKAIGNGNDCLLKATNYHPLILQSLIEEYDGQIYDVYDVN